MAVPTITSLSATAGPTAGRVLVEVLGTNFAERVEVKFGTKPGTRARVLESGRLTVLTPIHDVGLVAVSVQNLDEDGVAVAGELASLADAYTFARPRIRPSENSKNESDLTRLVRAFIRELKRQVIPEVALATHTDYDEDTLATLYTAKLAKLPAITLVGPELRENRLHSDNEDLEVEISGSSEEEWVGKPPGYTVDLRFAVVGMSDRTQEMQNLMSAVVAFFHANKYLEMDKDESNPTLGTVRYEMDFTEDGRPRTTGDPANSNLRAFVAGIAIRGFTIEGFYGFDIGTTAGAPNQWLAERNKTVADDGIILDPTEQSNVGSPLIVESVKSPG